MVKNRRCKKEVQDPDDVEEQILKEDEQDPGNKLPNGTKRRGKPRKRPGCNQRRAARLVLASAGGAAPAEEGSL